MPYLYGYRAGVHTERDLLSYNLSQSVICRHHPGSSIRHHYLRDQHRVVAGLHHPFSIANIPSVVLPKDIRIWISTDIDLEEDFCAFFSIQNFVDDLQFRREGIWTSCLAFIPGCKVVIISLAPREIEWLALACCLIIAPSCQCFVTRSSGYWLFADLCCF